MVYFLVENLFIEHLILYYLIGSNSALQKIKEWVSKTMSIANETHKFLCIESIHGNKFLSNNMVS